MDSTDSDANEPDLQFATVGLLTALLTHVGYAVWQAAECEDTVAHLVVVHLRKARGIGEPAGLRVLGKEQSRTFGSLVSELKRNGVLEESVQTRLTALADERNWLVHRAKRENRGLLHDLPNLDRVVSRIAELAHEATELNTLLGLKFEEVVLASGVPKETIDAEAEALLAEWGY